MSKQNKQSHQPIANYSDIDTPILDALIKEAERIQRIADTASPEELRDKAALEKALRIASALNRLRADISDEMMTSIMALAGSSLGFKTDRDDKEVGYSIPVVKDCWIEATLKGARPTGNEWNIIAGRPYLTKEFYQRALPSLRGVSDVEVSPGVPRIAEGKTQVRMAVRWKFHGEQCELRDHEGKPGRVFVIKVTERMGDDAVIGKATRKALKAAYEQIAGFSLGDPDDEPTPQPRNGSVIDSAKLLDRAKADGLIARNDEPKTITQVAELSELISNAQTGMSLLSIDEHSISDHLKTSYGVKSLGELDAIQLRNLIGWIDSQLER